MWRNNNWAFTKLHIIIKCPWVQVPNILCKRLCPRHKCIQLPYKDAHLKVLAEDIYEFEINSTQDTVWRIVVEKNLVRLCSDISVELYTQFQRIFLDLYKGKRQQKLAMFNWSLKLRKCKKWYSFWIRIFEMVTQK